MTGRTASVARSPHSRLVGDPSIASGICGIDNPLSSSKMREGSQWSQFCDSLVDYAVSHVLWVLSGGGLRIFDVQRSTLTGGLNLPVLT